MANEPKQEKKAIIGRIYSFLWPDLGIIAAFTAFIYGIFQVYHPAAWIIGGVSALWLLSPKGKKVK